MLYRLQHLCLPLSISHMPTLATHHMPTTASFTYKMELLAAEPPDLLKIPTLHQKPTKWIYPFCLKQSLLSRACELLHEASIHCLLGICSWLILGCLNNIIKYFEKEAKLFVDLLNALFHLLKHVSCHHALGFFFSMIIQMVCDLGKGRSFPNFFYLLVLLKWLLNRQH